MKKLLILLLMVLFMVSGLIPNNKSTQKKDTERAHEKVLTKTYVLDHIKPMAVEKTLSAYFYRCSYDRNGTMFTVVIPERNRKKFEELLNQLDVEKKSILIRIFTVVASQEGKSSEITNKDLRNVLDELKKVLSFKAFHLDGVSALTVKDGQEYSRLQLSSNYSLDFRLLGVNIKKTKAGERTVGFHFELNRDTEKPATKLLESNRKKTITSTGTKRVTLLESETSVKENGYLVAGVSKIGKNGNSLVLVINAVIQ
jgi:hypothetical protein